MGPGWLQSRTIILALLAIAVVATTCLGTLEDLSTWLRGSLQAVGTLAGVALGARLQLTDERIRVEASARSALAHIVALGKSVQGMIAHAENHRASMTASPPVRVDTITRMTETYIAGVDAQGRTLLAQARAAAEVWIPYVSNADEYLNEMAGGSSGS